MIDAELQKIQVLRSIGQVDAYRDGAIALAMRYPDEVRAQLEAAYACDAFGEERVAITYYDAAWALGVPESERVGFLIGYGSTLRNVGRHDEATARLREGLEMSPENLAMRAFLGLAQHSAGQHRAATATLLSLALELAGNNDAFGGYQFALASYQRELEAGADE